MKLNKKIFFVLLLTMASACSALATDVERANLEKMRQQIGVFESVMNQNLSQTFPGPFAYLDKARGAYLPGYGVVFSFEINLNPQGANLGPFTPARPTQTAKERRDLAKKRNDMAREMSERVIADFGHTLDVSANESVTVVVHGSAAGEQGIEKSTVILRAQKRDIDQFRSNAIDRAKFLQRVEVLEY